MALRRFPFLLLILLASSTCPKGLADMVFPRFPSVISVQEGHLDDIAADCARLCRETVVDGFAVSASLQPEGDPPRDKAAPLARSFRALRDRLAAGEIPLGVLLQSTMGHRAQETPANFQRIVYSNGDSPPVYCPLDEDFRAYIRSQTATLAAERPAFFLLDDDARLRAGRDACFCPLHLAEFSRRTGRDWTNRESLRAALATDPALAAEWERLRFDSIAALARDIRAAFDAVDPEIPGALCFCAAEARDALPLGRLLAAPGQRPVLRLNNARYLRDGNRDLPLSLLQTYEELLTLPEDADALVLDEPDTCPQNRYSMSAANFHLHLSLGLLSGCGGGKLWITRLGGWEPASGVAYRRVLARNAGFHRELLRLAPKWEGLRIPLATPAGGGLAVPPPEGDWGTRILGRMGFPYAYVRPGDYDGPATSSSLSAAFPEPLPAEGGNRFAPFKTWFNETRKKEIAEVLRRLARDEGDLPCWYAGDAEVLLRAGRSSDGARIILLVPLSHDVLDEAPLVFPFGTPPALERLRGDGTWRPAAFDPATGLLTDPVLPAEPAVFRARSLTPETSP